MINILNPSKSFMFTATFTNTHFTRSISAAKKAARKGPVFITENGVPKFVLLCIEDYYLITGTTKAKLVNETKVMPTTILDI
jgi:prevent-host-death family protein